MLRGREDIAAAGLHGIRLRPPGKFCRLKAFVGVEVLALLLLFPFVPLLVGKKLKQPLRFMLAIRSLLDEAEEDRNSLIGIVSSIRRANTTADRYRLSSTNNE